MFTLPELPYTLDALAPVMSRETLEYHHGKHHKAYVDKLNELTASGPFHGLDLETIIRKTAGDAEHRVLFNQAGQHWNHSFFWLSMKPNGGGAMPAALEARIVKDFGSVAQFREAFKAACVSQFGSGWGWLAYDGEKLIISKTANADTPLTQGHTALLTCDVWEHAYYIDYRNMRPNYVEAFLDTLVDWDRVASLLDQASNRT